MIRILRKGEGYAISRPIAKYFYLPIKAGGKLLLAVVLIFCFQFVCLAQESRESGATEARAIAPIEMGDKIPDEIWQTPFTIIRYNEEPETIRLEEFKGKTIILDFWATWCASCILSMPKMHELAAAHPDDVVLINVTQGGAELISKFVAKTASPQIRELEDEFFTIVEGDVLKDLIPHRYIPHVAIINSEGVLEQVTEPRTINKEVLAKLVHKEEYHLPKYRANLDTTLLSPTFPDIKLSRPTYYTSVSGPLEGFMFPSGEKIDSINRIKHGFYVNHSLLRLLAIASKPGFSVTMPSRRIMIMDEVDKLESHHQRNPDYRRKEFDISYEYVLPIFWSKEEVLQRMYNDLSSLTGFYAEKVNRLTPCLVIYKGHGAVRRSEQQNNNISLVLDGILEDRRIPQKVGRSSNGAINYYQNTDINNLVYLLNNLKADAIPFVIDESGIDYRIDFDLPDDLADVDALQKCFVNQGLRLELENRAIDMFVVSEGSIDTAVLTNAPLELTKFGYVLKGGLQNE